MSAFSIPKQLRFLTVDVQQPGVGDYDIAKWKNQSRVKTTPNATIGKACREKTKESEAEPGPATYYCEKISTKAPRPVILGKSKDKENQGPGPGQYETFAMNNSCYKTNPNFSFTTSRRKPVLQQRPGPADYNLRMELYKKGSPIVIFSKDKKERESKEVIPGPGDYNNNSLHKKHAHKYSFGSEKKFKQWNKFIEVKERIPGPSAYNNSFKTKNIKGGKFFKNQKLHLDLSTPGPGYYEVSKVLSHRSPGYVIGNSSRNIFEGDPSSPGPADYRIPQTDKYNKVQTARVVFSRERKDQLNKSVSPGPAAYNVSCAQMNRKMFRLKGRRNATKADRIPGPQDYTPKYRDFMEKCPIATFGSEQRLKPTKQKIPGPGDYNIDQSMRTKSFFFPKQNKPKSQKTTPGPGDYMLKPYIGIKSIDDGHIMYV